MGLDGDPPPAPSRPLQAEQGSTLHRYSIGCSLSHAQSQCLGERKKKLKIEKRKKERKKSLNFCPSGYPWKNQVLWWITVGPLLWNYKHNHWCIKAFHSGRWVSHVSAPRALAWGRGVGSRVTVQWQTKRSSEFFLPLADLLLVSPSQAAHEAREAFLLQRQPSDLESQVEAMCGVLCFLLFRIRYGSVTRFKQPKRTKRREINTHAFQPQPRSVWVGTFATQLANSGFSHSSHMTKSMNQSLLPSIFIIL